MYGFIIYGVVALISLLVIVLIAVNACKSNKEPDRELIEQNNDDLQF